jgi:hypothetical protein
MRDQAIYVAEAIQHIMTKFDKNQKFNIVAHSIGGIVAYYAMQSKKFPLE